VTQEVAASIMIALAVVLLALAGWGWRNRRHRFAHLEAHLIRALPSSPCVYECSGLYVATTVAGSPMDRVPVGPLSYRAKARFSLHPEGLVISAQGESPVLLTAPAGIDAGAATWTIDRVVEPDGLVMIRWLLGDVAVDSYVRIVETDSQAFIDTINALKGNTST